MRIRAFSQTGRTTTMVPKCGLVFFFVSLATGRFMNSFMGPFDVVFHNLERCQGSFAESKLFDFYPMHVTRDRHNPRGWWYNGTANISEDFTNKIFLDARVASWGSRGGWVENAYVYKADKLCDKVSLLYPDHLTKNFTAAMGMNPGQKQWCPILKGVYKVENYYIDLDISKYVPPLPYGKYRVESRYARDKRSPIETCYRAYVDFVPKPRGTSGSLTFQQIG